MQSDKDVEKEQNNFDQTVALIREGKNDEAMSILQNTNLHRKTSTPEKLTLLHIAVEAGNEEMVRHLVELGSDVEAKTASGLTPLMLAVEKKHEFIVNILIKKCNTSYIDVYTKLATIDTKSIEWKIFYNIFMKQSCDLMATSEFKSYLAGLKELFEE